MIKVIDTSEDTVTRKVTKLFNDEDESTLTISEFFTDDNISVGNMLKSDSFNFAPTPELMQQIVNAVVEYKEGRV